MLKRNMLINEVPQGGIKMIDVEALFQSVKAAWVIRILHATDSDIWTKVAKFYLRYHINDGYIFKLNLTGKQQCDGFPCIPIFYREVLFAFNKAKCISKEHFCNHILDQPLWANDYITYQDKGSETSLYFQRWIDAGILKICNLRFIDGVIDDQFIHDTVLEKINIFSEISRLKAALKPYAGIIGNHMPYNEDYMPLFMANGRDVTLYEFINCKSKYFYKYIVADKLQRPMSEVYWQSIFELEDDDFRRVYVQKIANVKDKKVAEFNFKMLHNILPCNVNLVRWKKKENKSCNLCGEDENIVHLLFYCNFARCLWRQLSQVLNMSIEIQDIITGSGCSPEIDFLISLFAYLIYKQWLCESLNDIKRVPNMCLKKLFPDLKCRMAMYRVTGWQNYVDIITHVLESIDT